MTDPNTPPTKDEIAGLEPFDGLELEQIFVVSNVRQAGLAVDELLAAGEVGFDTESKPTFHKGQKSEGPHVLQFSTTQKAFIFQSHVEESHAAVMQLLGAPELMKIGFGLRGDLHQISERFNLRPSAIIDLDREFKKLGFRNAVGAKSAIAMLFQRRLLKSKAMTTSNWAAKQLSDRQLLYAANDAYAAIMVHRALREAGGPPVS